ncbi:phosphatase PAP2 family protein [Gordonia sp. (in: high G+C Gram-positive bacteria)]|uniref:phosphatase PAP2 family protein n=1 Tax=Gordonia sp. (in: high G+C Gram-positive bacteria) TaxID=84139 RepID=UPI003C78D359
MQQFSFDNRITDWVVESRHEPLTSIVHLVTVFGDTLTLTLVVIGVLVLTWLSNRIDLSALIVLGAISAYVMMLILKVTFARPRPPVEDRLIDVGGASFPSGHAMLSTVVYGLTAVIVFRLFPRVRARSAVLLWAPGLVVLIGLSRVYLGVHWMSDVLFGWIFGILWLVLCLFAHDQLIRRPALLRVGTKRSVNVSARSAPEPGRRVAGRFAKPTSPQREAAPQPEATPLAEPKSGTDQGTSSPS